MAGRSTQAELEVRIREIQDLLLAGETRSQIVQFGSKWGVSDRQVDDYIKLATERIREANQLTLQDQMAIITSQLWNLFRQARNEANLSEQRHTLLAIAKLRGLDGKRTDYSTRADSPFAHLSDEELDAILATES